MERIRFANSRGLDLVGDLARARSPAAVVMAHGFTGDRSSRGRFDRIARRLQEAGYSALRFDFSGCGESDDDSLTSAKLEDDLRAAIAYTSSLGYSQIALWGHSLGSYICLRAYSPAVATMVLTGALTGPMHYRWADYYSAEQLRELEESGQLTEHRAVGPRRQVVIDAQMLQDFALIDQPSLLNGVNCPVLIIHGDNDPEERLLLENSRRGIQVLSPESRLEVIPGADHTLMEHLDQVIDLGCSWLAEQLP